MNIYEYILCNIFAIYIEHMWIEKTAIFDNIKKCCFFNPNISANILKMK